MLTVYLRHTPCVCTIDPGPLTAAGTVCPEVGERLARRACRIISITAKQPHRPRFIHPGRGAVTGSGHIAGRSDAFRTVHTFGVADVRSADPGPLIRGGVVHP